MSHLSLSLKDLKKEKNNGVPHSRPVLLAGASTARLGTGTWDSIIISKLPFNVVPLEDSASAGTRLGQSHVEVARVKEGLSRHSWEGQGLVQHKICGDGGCGKEEEKEFFGW